MTEELPEGWTWTKLEGVCELQSGFGFPNELQGRTQEELPFAKVSDLSQALRDHDVLINHAANSISRSDLAKVKAKTLPPGSVIFAKIGEAIRLNRRAVTAVEMVIDNNVMGLIPRRGAITTSYLLHWSRSVDFYELASSTTVPSLRKSDLAEVQLPLPPLAEQRRIVAKIEELTARSRAARAALAEVPALLEQFRQSVLASAFRGDLTSDWRAKHPDAEPASILLARIRDERRKQWEAKYPKRKYVAPAPVDDTDLPELPAGWEYASADEIVATGTVITYGIVLPGDQVEGGVPYVRGQDIEDGRVLVGQLARTSPEIAARHDRSALLEGDVLLCIIRHLKVAIVPAGLDGANLTQGTVRLRPSEAILGPYLAGYLAGPTAQGWMKERYFGMAMPRINVEDARAIPIPVAPLEEQREIIRQIEVNGRRHQAVVAAVNQALDEMSSLDQSILAKAFCGELVPQDPADEPASVLLERIRREREAGTNGTAAATKKRRTKTQ